jgi:hypothetical protein
MTDDEMRKALANYAGTVQQCPPGAASTYIKKRMRRRKVLHDEQRGNYYRCEVCHMWHRDGFAYERDGKLITQKVNGTTRLVEPPPWVWSTPPEEERRG